MSSPAQRLSASLVLVACQPPSPDQTREVSLKPTEPEVAAQPQPEPRAAAEPLGPEAWVQRPFDPDVRAAVLESLGGRSWVFRGNWLRGDVTYRAFAVELRGESARVYNGAAEHEARVEVVAPCKLGLTESTGALAEVTNYHTIAYDGARLHSGRGGLERGGRMIACHYELYAFDGDTCTRREEPSDAPQTIPCRIDDREGRTLVLDDPVRGAVEFAIDGGLLRSPLAEGGDGEADAGAPFSSFAEAKARVDALNRGDL
jgi:hypothetical protein